jgi:hypothetical protein
MGKKSQSAPKPEIDIFVLSSGMATILPSESVEDIEEIENELNEEFEPTTPAEQFLVDQMIHARWKLARTHRLEAQAFANLVGNEDGSDTGVLKVLKVPGNIFDKLDKMAAALDRAYSKAVRDLAQLRANARKRKNKTKPKPAASRSLPPNSPKYKTKPNPS